MLKNLLQKNPTRGEDVLLCFSSEQPEIYKGIDHTFTLHIRYAPDRDILPLKSFNEWHTSLRKETWENVEALAGEILNIFYDTILPLWIDICLEHKNDDGTTQRILLSKSQPQFKASYNLKELIDKR